MDILMILVMDCQEACRTGQDRFEPLKSLTRNNTDMSLSSWIQRSNSHLSPLCIWTLVVDTGEVNARLLHIT